MESYGNKQYSNGIPCNDKRARSGEEGACCNVDRTRPLIVRDGPDSLCVRVPCTRNDIRLGNFKGNAANILIALAAGIILTGFYLWRRDLVANMIGHGLVDFVGNVLPRLFS